MSPTPRSILCFRPMPDLMWVLRSGTKHPVVQEGDREFAIVFS